MIGKVLVAALAALCGAGVGTAALADTFTESVQFGPRGTDFAGASGTTAGPNGTSLYFFDSNGGTLNSITVNYGYSISGMIQVSNTSDGMASGTVRAQSGAQFTSDASAVTAALNNYVNNYYDSVNGTAITYGISTLTPIAADVRGNTSSYSLAAGSSANYTSNGEYSATFLVTNASFLAAFSQAGGGTFTPLLTTLSGLDGFSSQGSTNESATLTAQGNLAISYNYTAGTPTATQVPEPASIAMLSAGLLGLLLARRQGAGRRGTN